MKKLLLLFCLSLTAVLLFAQDTIPPPPVINPFPEGETSVSELIGMYEILYSALIVLWGYIGRLFKFTANVKSYVFVVLAGGIVLAIAFVWLGFSSVFPLVFSFLGAIGIYDIFLKPAGVSGEKIAGFRK